MRFSENLNLPILQDGDKYSKEIQNEAFNTIDRECTSIKNTIKSALDISEDVSSAIKTIGDISEELSDLKEKQNEDYYELLESNNYIGDKIRDINSQLESIKNNVTYVSSMEDDLQTIINNCDTTLIFERNKTYELSSTLKLKPNVLYDFNNCTINFSGEDICIDTSPNKTDKFFIKNLNINMTLNNPTQVGINLYKVNGGLLEDIRIYGGGYAIKSTNSWSYKLKNIKITNPKLCGYYHQGDKGCEINADNIYIGFSGEFTGKYGAEIERTTADDKGGYYFNEFLVVCNKPSGASLEQGIYIHSSSSSASTVVFNLTGGGVDGFNTNTATTGNFGIKLDNVGVIRIDNAWVMSIAYYNKVDNVIISNTNLAYGNYFKTSMAVYNLLISNCSVAQNTCFNYDDESSTGAIYYNNIRTNLISNDISKLLANKNPIENQLYLSSNIGNSILKLVRPEDNTSFNLSINSLGQLVLGTPNNTKLSITNNGSIRVPNDTGYVAINEKKVIGSQVTGWTTPTGTAEKRNGYDSTTVTLEELANVVRALIIDLKKHGLIGS